MSVQFAYFKFAFSGGVDPKRFTEYPDYSNDKKASGIPVDAVDKILAKSQAKVRYDEVMRALTGVGSIVYTNVTQTGDSAFAVPTNVEVTLGFHDASAMFDSLTVDKKISETAPFRPPYDVSTLTQDLKTFVDAIMAKPIEGYRYESFSDPMRHQNDAASPPDPKISTEFYQLVSTNETIAASAETVTVTAITNPPVKF